MSDKKKKDTKARKLSVIESLLLGCPVSEIPRLIPGVLLAGAVVGICIWLTDLLNTILGFKGLISYILMVIVVGILVRNTIGVSPVFNPGISFCLRVWIIS